LCRDGEVIVSRGQLVEIGGSFRLPDVMVESGAILREVGSTNRTRISDYDAAIGENSAALLRVHTSNYRIVGFAREASLEELVSLGRERGLLVIDDVGSGAMFDVSAIGCGREPVVRESIEAGADLVCFSGDKLLGGPQAGIVVGRWELVARMERHPLMRAVRADKMTLAALGATLRHYRDVEGAMACVPVVGMLAAPLNVVSDRAARLQWLLSDGVEGEEFHVASDVSYAGGGSLPGEGLETVVVRWRPSGIGAEEAARRLRLGSPPVVARVNEGAVVFDVRTIGDDDLEAVARLVASVLDDISLEND
jgi:L-seryl-tRNA(Ser) seleniumtransferase